MDYYQKIAKRFTTNFAAYEYLADSILNFPTRSEFISLIKFSWSNKN